MFNSRSLSLLFGWCLIALTVHVQAQKLVSTIKPVQLVVNEITGSALENKVLMAVTDSPHHYALSVSDRRTLAEADLVFWLGPALEVALTGVLGSESSSVALYAEANPHLAYSNPHVWLDPVAIGAAALQIKEALSLRFPEKSPIFNDNYAEFTRNLAKLDVILKTRLAPLKSARIVFHHDSFIPLAERYGLDESLVLLPGHARQASVKTSLAVSRALSNGDVNCMVTDPGLPQALLRSLNVSKYSHIIKISPIYGAPKTEPESYFELMDEISELLGGCSAPPPGFNAAGK